MPIIGGTYARFNTTQLSSVDREVLGPAPDARPGGGGSRSGGTVRSVAMSVPSDLLAVTGSPITQKGTLAVTLPTRAANLIFAGPASGGDAAPAFRALALGDLPNGASGTFVPEFTFSTPGDLSVAYTTQSGRYVRIGSLVFVKVELVFTPTHTTASGDGTMTGLPFTSANIGGQYLVATQFEVAAALPAWPAGVTNLFFQVTGNASTGRFRGMGNGIATVSLGVAEFGTGVARNVQAAGWYIVP